MRVAVHSSDGRILRVLDCAPAQVAANVCAGEAWAEIPPGVSDATHYIANGAAVEMPARPGAQYVFDYATLQWIDPRTIEQLRTAWWVALKRDRDAAEWGGFTWDGSVFDSDPLSQSRIQGAVQLATISASQGQTFSVDWTLADNSVRTLSGSDMVAVGMALAMHVQAQHARGRDLRTQVTAANSQLELSEIQW